MKKESCKYRKQEKGVTLIILVVTIVIMIILAGTTINMVFGENGALQQSKKTQDMQKEHVKQEDNEVNNLLNLVEETNEIEQPEVLKADGSFSNIKKVNTPKLGNGMTPIKWDEKANDGKGDWKETVGSDMEWYDYSNTSKKWANAMTEDGSMWVWIPRYAYQIASNYHNGGSGIYGEINIKFLKGIENISADGETTVWENESGDGNWNVHPAFTNKVDIGGWKENIPGIWVAKFQASHSDAQIGKVGTSATLKVVPSVRMWRSIAIGEIFDTCLEYNRTLNSHQMKNSEWGAVAYLSQSNYGKSDEIGVNQCGTFITGAGPGEGESEILNETYTYSADNFITTYSYTTTQGRKASTTGNVWGIYDMTGGTFEYTAAYINNEYVELGKEQYAYAESLITSEEKHLKQVYDIDPTDTSSKNLLVSISNYGDAIYETSLKPNNFSWFGDHSAYPYGGNPFFRRGGSYNNGEASGIFNYHRLTGNAGAGVGFRPVLVI